MSHIRVVSPGHKYDLLNLENPVRSEAQRILFIRKEKSSDGSGKLITVHNGTTNEAVIEMLVDRLTHLNEKLESPHNAKAIEHLEAALVELNTRTKKREKAGVEGTVKDLEGNIPDAVEQQQPEESEAADQEPATPQEDPDLPGYKLDDTIPEEMPWDSYLVKNDLSTIGQVKQALEGDGLAGLKYFNEQREQDVAAWLAENL